MRARGPSLLLPVSAASGWTLRLDAGQAGSLVEAPSTVR